MTDPDFVAAPKQLVVNAAMATFQDLDARRRLVDDVIRPGSATLA